MLSAIIIAKDEEKKLPDCLKSLSWVDEIVVIDTGSIDKTKKIAKKFGAKVYKFQGGSYSDWRNEGLKRGSGDWILYIDADERVTPLLHKEIESRITNHESRTNAYAIPRKNIILGKELKHGGWWPDYVKRLYFKRNLRRWKGDLHEEPEFDGEMGHLTNPLLHIKHDNLSEMVEKTNKWSGIEAKLMYDANHPKMNSIRFFSSMFREFWKRVIREQAYLDGQTGVIYALYQVYSRFISYAKLWEMQLRERNTNIRIRANVTNKYG